MIDNMASLKQAMEQMDMEDPAAAQAGKDRAARILDDATMSFSKLAELIERRRLLLRPRIVASIRRMDQPDMLGEAAFRDAGSALRREGQSFRQIAEAIELNDRPAPPYTDPVQTSEPLHPMETISEPGAPTWLRALALAARVGFYPIRHPLRFLTIAVLAIVLFDLFRGFEGFGQQVTGVVNSIIGARQRVDKAVSSVSSLVDKPASRQSQEAAAPATPPSPIPSPQAAAQSTAADTASAPPTHPPAPSANEAAPLPPPSAAPAAPPTSTPNLNARAVPPSKSAANDRARTARPRTFEDLMPREIRRDSRLAGPCTGGVGGCYWGGSRY